MANATLKMFNCISRNAALLQIPKRFVISSQQNGCVSGSMSFSRFLSTSHQRFNSKLEPERKYSDKHEWISVRDGVGTVGISHYAQESLGEIVYAQLPEVGDSFEASDEVGALESVKAASEVYAPVSGEIVDKNDQVEETPSLINKSCYDKGWLYKVKLDDPNQVEKLMTEEAYQEYLKTQAHD